jgi:glycine oxidase
MSSERPADVVVVGGGVIGLAVAWRARGLGMSVTVLERDECGQGTSRVAAGMLAPVAEVEFGEAGRRVLELGLRSASAWPSFAEELAAAAGTAVELMRSGTLLVARDEDEAREAERQLAFRESLGLRVERLRASAARALEPALAPTVRLALSVPDDHAVDPRDVLAALRAACESAGVTLREHALVARVELDSAGERVTGVELADGERVGAGQLVLAAGPWAGQLAGLPEGARVPVRPVKGQILRLRDPAGPGLVTRVVRFEGGYVLPRGDGRYVLGGTVEERGFDLAPTAGAAYEMLRVARELVPGVSELEIEELSVGLRPGTPDNAPAIGPGALEGLIWATGHYRNGILLAPLTAELVAGMLQGRALPGAAEELLGACDPLRFASTATGTAATAAPSPAPGREPARPAEVAS